MLCSTAISSNTTGRDFFPFRQRVNRAEVGYGEYFFFPPRPRPLLKVHFPSPLFLFPSSTGYPFSSRPVRLSYPRGRLLVYHFLLFTSRHFLEPFPFLLLGHRRGPPRRDYSPASALSFPNLSHSSPTFPILPPNLACSGSTVSLAPPRCLGPFPKSSCVLHLIF